MDALKPSRTGGRHERGFTLIEVVVLTAILAIVAAVGCAALAQRPAQAAATAMAFAGLVSEGRSLAAVSGDSAWDGASGATIGVVRDGTTDVATLYAYRPMRGAAQAPLPAPGSVPLRSPTALGLLRAGRISDPPFAIFISASGHVSAKAPFTVGVDAPLAAEPPCPLQTGIVIVFRDGVHDRGHALSCEMARLDLDAAIPLPSL